MADDERCVILNDESSKGRWGFVIYTTTNSPYIRADIRNLDQSAGGALLGISFGPYPPLKDPKVTIRWDLPDNVCGIYIDADCYGLFRCGAGRRRARGSFRAGIQTPFTEDEIAWFCAKTHVQFRRGD
ncbi:MAG: hypothetical protein ABIY70_01085 [Capsulimonas sp.]|uniref:hypothetical protein n=1 Tax=Capsulimonas sp. TaxID=2494211 RepID=UPI0032679F25